MFAQFLMEVGDIESLIGELSYQLDKHEMIAATQVKLSKLDYD